MGFSSLALLCYPQSTDPAQGSPEEPEGSWVRFQVMLSGLSDPELTLLTQPRWRAPGTAAELLKELRSRVFTGWKFGSTNPGNDSAAALPLPALARTPSVVPSPHHHFFRNTNRHILAVPACVEPSVGYNPWPWLWVLRIHGLKLTQGKEHFLLSTYFVFREETARNKKIFS